MIRLLNPEDDDAVRALLERARDSVPTPPLELAWTSRVSGGDTHLMGLTEGGALRALGRLNPVTRPRMAHLGGITLLCPRVVDAEPLLGELVALADGWTVLNVLMIRLPADHPAVGAAERLGFQVEVRRRGRWPDGRDELTLSRSRPGWQPTPPGPHPPWPPPRLRQGGDVGIRPITDADIPDVARISVQPTNVWGTLQTPSSNLLYYQERHQSTPTEHHVVLVTVDGMAAGLGGLHPTGIPGVWTLGMSIDEGWQGQGLGGRLLEHLCQAARDAGIRRLELSVWEDNVRARRLYDRAGFVVEGVHRAFGFRAGGYASSVEMVWSPGST